MRGRLALQHRNPSAVRSGWQGLEPCPDGVTHSWRHLARKHQEASGSADLCVGARPSHETRPPMEAVVAQGIQPVRLMPRSPSPLPSRARAIPDRHDDLRSQESQPLSSQHGAEFTHTNLR